MIQFEIVHASVPSAAYDLYSSVQSQSVTTCNAERQCVTASCCNFAECRHQGEELLVQIAEGVALFL